MRRIELPKDNDSLKTLTAGETISLSGTIYTLRDAGHRRLRASYEAGRPDTSVSGMTLYYCGPTPTAAGDIIGSCGPTTSARMDDDTPYLLEKGLVCMIGKGGRSEAVRAAMKAAGAVYLVAVGGAGALYKAAVTDNQPALYDDLGCEAMRRLTVKDMELLVGIDAKGNSIID